MNKYEFVACGTLLYGSRWRTDLAKSLGYSTKGRMVNLIEQGERNIPQSKIEILSQNLKSLSRQLLLADEWISRKQDKIIVVPSKGSHLVVDEQGIQIIDSSCREQESAVDIQILNVAIQSPIPEFLGLVFAVAHIEAKQSGNNHELLQLLLAYFDFRAIAFEPDFYRVG